MLSVVSFIYIGIVILLIKETGVCHEMAIPANAFKGFWDEYLGCRSINELGDTLAGAFAPVAFLWLMGAEPERKRRVGGGSLLVALLITEDGG